MAVNRVSGVSWMSWWSRVWRDGDTGGPCAVWHLPSHWCACLARPHHALPHQQVRRHALDTISLTLVDDVRVKVTKYVIRQSSLVSVVTHASTHPRDSTRLASKVKLEHLHASRTAEPSPRPSRPEVVYPGPSTALSVGHRRGSARLARRNLAAHTGPAP